MGRGHSTPASVPLPNSLSANHNPTKRKSHCSRLPQEKGNTPIPDGRLAFLNGVHVLTLNCEAVDHTKCGWFEQALVSPVFSPRGGNNRWLVSCFPAALKHFLTLLGAQGFSCSPQAFPSYSPQAFPYSPLAMSCTPQPFPRCRCSLSLQEQQNQEIKSAQPWCIFSFA